MAFSDFIDARMQHSRESIAALQSLREQIEVRLSEFAGVIQNNFERVITFSHYDELNNTDVICQISSEQLRQCLNEEVENVNAVISPIEAEYPISRDEVCEAFEKQVQELQIQKEFLSACLDNSEVNVHTWTTTVLEKYQNMTASFVETFAQHFRSGDKIQALQSWCRTYLVNTPKNQGDQYITVTKRSEFGGSDVTVLSIILADIKKAINSAFADVWQGIQDLYGFFQRLWQGIQNLAGWILRKTFRSLASNLETGDNKYGYLDMPIFQSQVGAITVVHGHPHTTSMSTESMITGRWGEMIDLIIAGKINLRTNASTGYYKANYSSPSSSTTPYAIPHRQLSRFKDSLATFDEDVGDYVFRTVDILWCGPKWNPNLNLLFRLGCVADDSNPNKYGVYLQIYYVCPSNIIDALTDYEVWQNMTLSFRTFVEEMGNSDKGMFPVIPTHNGAQYSDEDNAYYSYFWGTNLIGENSPTQTDGPVNFTNYIEVLSLSDWNSWYPTPPRAVQPNVCLTWLIFTTVIPYMLLFGPVNLYNAETGQLSDSDKVILFEKGYELADCDRSVNVSYITAFKPYSRNQPYGVSVHFQSMEDRATELEKYIIVMVVAAAAAYLTYKIIKARNNLIAKTAIARGQADNYAWTQGDFTPEKLAQWRKLNRIARRYERISSLFGVTSKLAVSQGLSSLVSNNDQKQVDDYSKIKTLIVG